MLDTILQIGKTFRHSADGLKYHRYIKSPMQEKEWNDITFLALPVNKDFSFDLANISLIMDENLKSKLYYLTYKTTEADNQVKYLFGDIFYVLKDGKEGGYYRLPDLNNKQKSFHRSSFYRVDVDSIKKKMGNQIGLESIEKFRDSFSKNIEEIEKLLFMQSGFVEYLSSPEYRNIYTPSGILKNEEELKKLNAKNVWKYIKQKRNANKILAESLKLKKTEWDEIENNERLLTTLNSYGAGRMYLHFDFCGKHWYELDNVPELINTLLRDEFIEKSPHSPHHNYILKKGLYKTLSTSKEDYQFPGFSLGNRYKNKLFFDVEEINDLFYAIDYSKKGLVNIPYTNIKIIVLPKGMNLTTEDYVRFVEKDISLVKIPDGEEIIKQANEFDEETPIDGLFINILNDTNEAITQFDLILSKRGSQNNPDSDIIELAGIEKSFINFISTRISRITSDLLIERADKINAKKLGTFKIHRSFLNILGEDKAKEKKKYQNHLYTVLPLIYSGTYYRDPILLPAFVEKAERKIRDNEIYYNSFKYDFYFLTKIQNTPTEGENLMKILESPSYKLGLSLGIMSRPFAAWRDDCPIKSFEKNYVGNLTRRISSLEDLIKFTIDIDQKLIMHDRTYSDIKDASLTLANDVKTFEGKFDKNECAFGFFESYFNSSKKNEDNTEKENPTEN